MSLAPMPFPRTLLELAKTNAFADFSLEIGYYLHDLHSPDGRFRVAVNTATGSIIVADDPHLLDAVEAKMPRGSTARGQMQMFINHGEGLAYPNYGGLPETMQKSVKMPLFDPEALEDAGTRDDLRFGWSDLLMVGGVFPYCANREAVSNPNKLLV